LSALIELRSCGKNDFSDVGEHLLCYRKVPIYGPEVPLSSTSHLRSLLSQANILSATGKSAAELQISQDC